MIAVTDAWKDVQQRFLLPETFVEINCGITDTEAQSVATATGTNEATFSQAAGVVAEASTSAKHVTAEHNLWALDGTMNILPDASPAYAGYVSNIEATGSVTISFPAIRTNAVSGVTITWSEAFDEYPTIFTVSAKNGDEVIDEVTVTDNTENVSLVNLAMENYDSVTISVLAWSLPHRWVRIERVVIGHVLQFGKSDLISFNHEQSGDILSGQLPKYSVEFTLDNSDGRWDPNNPSGMGQYLSERQRLTVRYGLDIDGTVEWIPGGVFYLSEWEAPPNGLEARFVARDVFEFLVNKNVTKNPNISTSIYGNLVAIITWATNSLYLAGITIDTSDEALTSSQGRSPDISGTNAEIVQKCANAACCILRYDRSGALYIEQLNTEPADYLIPLSLSYSYPEIALSKPLASVLVDYGGEAPHVLSVADSGEEQTVSNDYIYSEEAAQAVAEWVRDALQQRKTISGEFRADPRLDLYDIVNVEDRYGRMLRVVITDIKYTYTGAFRGSFTGRILEEV